MGCLTGQLAYLLQRKGLRKPLKYPEQLPGEPLQSGGKKDMLTTLIAFAVGAVCGLFLHTLLAAAGLETPQPRPRATAPALRHFEPRSAGFLGS